MSTELIQRIRQLEREVERLQALEARDLFLPVTMVTSGFGLTTNAYVCGMVLTRTPIYINRFQAVCRVNTTNNATNYWDLILATVVGGVGISSASTSALAPSSTTFSAISGSVGTNIAVGEIGLYVFAARTGAPGILDVLGVLVNAA